MHTVTTEDGTTIYFKDWGKGQPITFSHGWPLNADAWDAQMLFLGQRGYRVIAHDRRGHGRENFWFQGMQGSVKGEYDCIKAFSETDFTEDLKKIDVPSLVLHGDDDQIVPIGASGLLSAKLIKNATLKVYPGQPHGMCTTNADQINADLLAFIKA